jgi:hypothetical protein
MLKITSFSALIVGLLLAIPIVFSDAEASRTETAGVATKADRELTAGALDSRLTTAFQLVDVCSRGVSGDAGSWCAARHAQLSDTADVRLAAKPTVYEFRDEASQTSTLSIPSADLR